MANFLQLNDPNILNQTRNMSWGQALQTENPFSKSYQGYNPSYKGADKTSLKGYAKQGIESLKGNFLKGSNVGGATPLTRKLALTAMNYGPKISRIANPIGAAMLGAEGGAKLGDWAYKNWEPATKFGDWAGGGIYDFLNPKETSIDPTGKNLFTQYHEDDPYAGIEGQTAYLQYLPEIMALLKAGTSKKQIGEYLLKNQILKQTGKKIGPDLRRKIRQTQGEKFGGSGIFKNIATGSKDYGPYTKPTTKPYVAPLGPRGEASEQITETAAEKKAKIQAAHNAQQRIQQRSLHQGPNTPGGGGGGPPGGDPGWKGNSGGLVNFYRYGGFI